MITRLLLATLAMFFVGLLGYCGLMLGAGVPYGSGIELIFYTIVYGQTTVVPALVVYWTLCVPASILLGRSIHVRQPLVLYPLLTALIEAGVAVSVCWLLPTCSAREMRSFSALYAVMGLIGGAAYAGPNGKAK
jgi:hypothetical protein